MKIGILFSKKIKNYSKNWSLFLVLENQALFADGETVLFAHKKAVEILFCPTFLSDPGFASVGRAEDRATVSDDPSVLVVGEIDARKRFGIAG